MGESKHLALSVAQINGRLQEFIAQEEARGVGPANEADVITAIERLAKLPRSKDQTLHSPNAGGSTGKKTR